MEPHAVRVENDAVVGALSGDAVEVGAEDERPNRGMRKKDLWRLA